jgi:hypothetical protein
MSELTPQLAMVLLIVGAGLLVAPVALAAYLLGRWRGARRADRVWTTWTGIEPSELPTRQFERELRDLRNRIGRAADYWPEGTRED